MKSFYDAIKVVMIEKEKQSILLVDTDPLNRQSIQDVLRDLDVDIVVSDSAGAVIDLAGTLDEIVEQVVGLKPSECHHIRWK